MYNQAIWLVLAPDPALKRLGGLLRPMFLIEEDFSLTWLVAIAAHQLLMARASSTLKSELIAGAPCSSSPTTAEDVCAW
jgi:hypothetical protein